MISKQLRDIGRLYELAQDGSNFNSRITRASVDTRRGVRGKSGNVYKLGAQKLFIGVEAKYIIEKVEKELHPTICMILRTRFGGEDHCEKLGEIFADHIGKNKAAPYFADFMREMLQDRPRNSDKNWAERLGVAPQTLYNWRRGNKKNRNGPTSRGIEEPLMAWMGRALEEFSKHGITG